MAAYKQQYEDLLGSVSQHLKLISSCVEAEILRCNRKKIACEEGGGDCFLHLLDVSVGEPIRIRMFLGLPNPDLLVRGMDPDLYPSLFS